MKLLMAHNFSTEEAHVDAPNFYHACAQSVFPSRSISTTFLPDLRQSLVFRTLQRFGVSPSLSLLLCTAVWIVRNRKKFDVIFGWLSNGIIVALLRRLFGWRRPSVCVVSYRLWDTSKKGAFAIIKRKTVRYALQGCDFLIALDTRQARYFEQELGRAKNTTAALRYGVYSEWYDHLLEYQVVQKNSPSIIFCPGSAYRDDFTFMKAISGLDVEIKRYQLDTSKKLQSDLQRVGRALLNSMFNAPYSQYVSDCLQSDIVVISVMNQDKPVGLTSLLECMTLGRPIIITKGLTSNDYVEDGVNALLYEEGNWQQLRERISFLLNNPEEARRLGMAARERMQKEYGLEQSGYAFSELLLRLYDVHHE